MHLQKKTHKNIRVFYRLRGMAKIATLVCYILRALSIFPVSATEEICDQGVFHYEPTDIPEIPRYTEPANEMTQKMLVHGDTVHPKKVSSDIVGFYRYELANGTTMYSLYSWPELIDQGVVFQKLDTKRNLEYIIYGIGIYTTTYGVLRVTARATNNGVLHRVADLLGGIGIELAVLLRAIFLAFIIGTSRYGEESLRSSRPILKICAFSFFLLSGIGYVLFISKSNS